MNKIVRLLSEVRAELRKVTWPKRDELVSSTIIVFIIVIFFAVLLGAMDFGFSTLIRKIFGYR